MKLILGSASPRRRELLAQLGLEPFDVRPADIDETPFKGEAARDYVARMAREKAM
ncbi:Maf family protein, partial [Thioclava sp.]